MIFTQMERKEVLKMYNYEERNKIKPSSMDIEELKKEIDEIKEFLEEDKKKPRNDKIDRNIKAKIEIRKSKLVQAQREKIIKNRLTAAKNSSTSNKKDSKRTNRLCEVAGTLEIYFGELDLDDAFNLLRFLLQQDKNGGYASKALGREYTTEKIQKAEARIEELKKKAAEKRARKEQMQKEKVEKAIAAKAAKKAAAENPVQGIDYGTKGMSREEFDNYMNGTN